MKIKTADEFKLDEILSSIKHIFFESSSIRSFKGEVEREQFFQNWCGQYLENYPHCFFLAIERGTIAGYLCLFDSLASHPSVPGHAIFANFFKEFPAHFHINCHIDFRGKGVGSNLINKAIEYLKKNQVRGVHIITSPGSRNVQFYKNNKFKEVEIIGSGERSQLMMGLILKGPK